MSSKDLLEYVGDKAKGWISKRLLQEKKAYVLGSKCSFFWKNR